MAANRLPTFLTGLSETLARWQLDCTLSLDRLPSISRSRKRRTCGYKTPFWQSVSGRVRFVPPDDCSVTPRELVFQAEAGKVLEVAA